MGRGVVSISGTQTREPVERFSGRLNAVDQRVADVARALLSGERVRSSDQQVSVTLGAKGAALAKLYVRAAAPEIELKLVIYVRPLTAGEIAQLRRADDRGPAAVDDWCRVVSDTESVQQQDWELFNCNITGVEFAEA